LAYSYFVEGSFTAYHSVLILTACKFNSATHMTNETSAPRLVFALTTCSGLVTFAGCPVFLDTDFSVTYP